MDTRNLRSTQYINPCKVGGEIRKTCFIKMRQLELINFSRLRTFPSLIFFGLSGLDFLYSTFRNRKNVDIFT